MGLKTRKKSRKRYQAPSEGQVARAATAAGPRILVVHRGSVGAGVPRLVEDIRNLLAPHVARHKVLRKTRPSDLVEAARGLSLSHCVLFTRTDEALYMKVAQMPKGPTVTYRVEGYSVSTDISGTQAKAPSLSPAALRAPATLMLHGLQPHQGPKHLQLVAASTLQLFAKFNPADCSTRQIKRCCLLHRTEDDTLELRHYALRFSASSGNRLLRKLANGRVPSLAKMETFDDAVDRVGLLSESEGEEDAVVSVPEDVKPDVKPDLEELAAPAPTVKRSLRLREVGPRLSFVVQKVETGFMAGDVLYHRVLKKSEKEVKNKELIREKRKQEKAMRKAEQEANVARKEALKEQHKLKCLQGAKATDEGAEADVSGSEDDEVKYYTEAVGEEPSADLAARMASKRKTTDDDQDATTAKKKRKKDEEMDERRRKVKEKFRALDANRKSKRPAASFRKRQARKIKNELKRRKSDEAAKKKENEKEGKSIPEKSVKKKGKKRGNVKGA